MKNRQVRTVQQNNLSLVYVKAFCTNTWKLVKVFDSKEEKDQAYKNGFYRPENINKLYKRGI